MVMMTGLLAMTVLVMVPFLLASARYVLLRTSRHPAWLHPRRPGPGLGATAAEELHAALNANKHVQFAQRQEERILRHDTHDGAPRTPGIDLDRGTARIRPHGRP